jgi:hypothetical protein
MVEVQFGLSRLVVLLKARPDRAVLVIGGLTVLLAAYFARRQAEDEKVDGRYPTFADKEPEPDAPPSRQPGRTPQLKPTFET